MGSTYAARVDLGCLRTRWRAAPGPPCCVRCCRSWRCRSTAPRSSSKCWSSEDWCDIWTAARRGDPPEEEPPCCPQPRHLPPLERRIMGLDPCAPQLDWLTTFQISNKKTMPPFLQRCQGINRPIVESGMCSRQTRRNVWKFNVKPEALKTVAPADTALIFVFTLILT